MRVILINAERLQERIPAHEYLKKLFGFPEYYGKNLDALYDCLTDVSEPTTIIVSDPDADGYAKRVLAVISEAAGNGFIHVINQPTERNTNNEA